MSLFEIGRLVFKIAGRDANRKGVIVDIIDANYVMVDGNLRRKKVNIKHLEPLDQTIEIKKDASHEDVIAEFKKLKLDFWDKKKKETKERPKKQKKKKPVKELSKKEKKAEEKAKAKEEKIEEKKEEVKEAPKEE